MSARWRTPWTACRNFLPCFDRTSVALQSVDALAHALAGVLKVNGLDGACFVAHSYGTFVASRMRQLYPEVRWASFREGVLLEQKMKLTMRQIIPLRTRVGSPALPGSC